MDHDNFWLTTWGRYHTKPFLKAVEQIGEDRFLFSVDYPYEQMASAALWFDDGQFSSAPKLKVGRENANKLLGLGLKAVSSVRCDSLLEVRLKEAVPMEQSPGPRPAAEHVTFARLARDATFELVLTLVLLFLVATIVRWVIGPSLISRVFPHIHAQLLIVGTAVAILLAGLILSPPGKISGGHMNPAISLAMWRFGVFPGAQLATYTIAQLLGSLAGVMLAREVWGPVVAAPPVAYAVIQPGPGLSMWKLAIAETLGMAVIVFVVGLCLGAHRLAPWAPWIVGAMVGTGIAVLGTTSGGSLNPARQFGPAVVSGKTAYLWVYLVAPMLGAVLAVELRQFVQSERKVLTHRLCGTIDRPHTQTGSYNHRAQIC
jgi:glycerol uptake facilitator-like aquaporin